MSTTSLTSEWYLDIEVFSSDYVPDSFEPGESVETNHALLGGLRENDFEITDSAYTLGLLTLFLVFIVAGVLACFLLPCLYCCLGTSRQKRLQERMRFGQQTHYKGNLLMVLASVAAVATAAGAVWGLQKADSGLTTIESSTQDVANDLLAILNLPTDTSAALDQVTAAYDTLRDSVDSVEGVEGCDTVSALAFLLDGDELDSLTDGVQSEIEGLNEESLAELAGDVQDVSDAVGETEGVRKGLVWPVLILGMLFTVVFVLVGIGTYECVAFGHRDCDALTCCISPCTIFVAVVIWLCAASAVTLSALSGDFCIDPDTNADTLITESSDSEQLTQLIQYYTGDCTTENEAVDAIIAAQEVAVPVIQEVGELLVQLADACDDLQAPVVEVNGALRSLWTVLEDAGELSSCENLNSLYQTAVYDELCTDVPKGLLGFWVSCSILTVLLLILVVQWNRMLRQQTTEEDAAAVEAMNRRRSSRMNAFQRFSRHNVFSSGSAASRGHAPRASGRSAGSSRSGAHAPVWGVHGATSGGGYPGGHSPVQRPVEIDKPVRAY
eukprot:g4879.t1